MKRFIGKRYEHHEQADLVSSVLLKYQHRVDFLRPLFFSTLSGAWIAGSGKRKIALIAKYKREGWVNGVADLLYLQPRGGYAYLAIEMKTKDRLGEKNGGATEDQLTWLRAARLAGAMVVICHCAERGEEVFSRYMALDFTPTFHVIDKE